MRCGVLQHNACCETESTDINSLAMLDALHWRAASSSPYIFNNSSQLQYRAAMTLDSHDSPKNAGITLLRDRSNMQACVQSAQTRTTAGSTFRHTTLSKTNEVDRWRSVEFSIDKQVKWANQNQGSLSDSTTNNPKYKTEMCRSVFAKVQCKYGDNCQFAHTDDEIRNRPHNNKYKTIDCKNFHQHGYCYYGPKCDFRHNEPLPPQSQFSGHVRKGRGASLIYSAGADSPSHRQTLGDASSVSSLSRAGSDGERTAPSDCAIAPSIADWSSTGLLSNNDWSLAPGPCPANSITSVWLSPVPQRSTTDSDWSSTSLNVSGWSAAVTPGAADWPPVIPSLNADWSMTDTARSTSSSRGSITVSSILSGEPSPTTKTQGAVASGPFDDWSSSLDATEFLTTAKQVQRSAPTASVFVETDNIASKVSGAEIAKDKQPIFYKFNDGSCHVIYV